MVSQQQLVCDNSTVANFKAWASALSNFIRTAGWTNSSDTGQLNGAGAGNWSSVTTVPGSGAFYYEIFQPGDALTTFYLYVGYGNATSSTNAPTLKIGIGTSTNGAGTLTGWTTWITPLSSSYTAPSTTTQYECDFSGTNNRLSILMWRTAGNNAPQFFNIERSINASGVYTGQYVSMWKGGQAASGGGSVNYGCQGFYQSLHFTLGYGLASLSEIEAAVGYGGIPALVSCFYNGSSSFNGSIPFSNAFPCIGYWDYPATGLGFVSHIDLADGVPFTITNQYGQSVTYMPTRSGVLWNVCGVAYNNTSEGVTLCVRYD